MKHQADNSRSEWRYCPYRMPKNKTEDVTLRVLPPWLHALTMTLYSQLSTLSRDQYAMNRAECLRQRSPAQTDLTLQWAHGLIRLIAQTTHRNVVYKTLLHANASPTCLRCPHSTLPTTVTSKQHCQWLAASAKLLRAATQLAVTRSNSSRAHG